MNDPNYFYCIRGLRISILWKIADFILFSVKLTQTQVYLYKLVFLVFDSEVVKISVLPPISINHQIENILRF